MQTRKWSTLLSDKADIDVIPVFSRHGKVVYLLGSSVKDGGWSLWVYRVPFAGGKPERLADLNGDAMGPSLWRGLDADDNRLLIRTTGNIYALTLDQR